MEGITYIRATADDIPEMIAKRIEFLTDIQGVQAPELIETINRNLDLYFHREINNGTYICILAKDGDQIVGTGGVILREHPANFRNPTGRFGHVFGMYTAPAYRRKGICRRILDELIKEAEGMGVKNFELHTTKEGEFVYVNYGFKLYEEPTYKLKLP